MDSYEKISSKMYNKFIFYIINLKTILQIIIVQYLDLN